MAITPLSNSTFVSQNAAVASTQVANERGKESFAALANLAEFQGKASFKFFAFLYTSAPTTSSKSPAPQASGSLLMLARTRAKRAKKTFALGVLKSLFASSKAIYKIAPKMMRLSQKLSIRAMKITATTRATPQTMRVLSNINLP